MRPSDLHFFPLAPPFVLGLFLLIGLLMALLEVGILKYAYTKIGVDPRYVFLVLLLSLVGSYINIPVVYLSNADKYRGLTRRPSQEQKGLDKRTLMASQRPFHPW